MSSGCEVAIVGGGPAGLTLAALLAQRGVSTCVLERSGLPTDKACGEGVMPVGLEVLEAVGARALLTELDCAPIVGIRYLEEDGGELAAPLPAGGGLGIRRTALSGALLARARALGARVLDRTAVRGLERTPTGMRVLLDEGPLEARMVVAADGLNSPLRRAMGLAHERPRGGVGARYGIRRHYAARPWTDHVEVSFAPGVEAYLTPAGRDRVGVAFLWGRLGGKQGFEQLLARFPVLRERLGSSAVDSEVFGAGPLHQTVRRRTLDRFALLGDAAGYVDAITGEGVSLALSAASTLGRVIPKALTRDCSMESLAEYERVAAAEFRAYARLTGSLLMLARRPWARRAALATLRRAPWMFEAILARVMRPRSVGIRLLPT